MPRATGLADDVYAWVKSSVLTGRSRPGDVLAAHSIARTLDVSRTPVHEALKRLVTEGYLTTRARVGYVVTPLNIDDLRDLFQVRIRLECMAAELAAVQFTPKDEEAFEQANRDARALSIKLANRSPEDPEVIETVDGLHQQFHRMLAEIGGNRRLTTLIATLQEETRRFWTLLPHHRDVQYTFFNDPGHREIFEAVASGDPELARDAVAQHMRDGMQQMLSSLLPDHPPPTESIDQD